MNDTILLTMLSKLKTVVTLVVFLSLVLIFFDASLNKEVFSEKYGLNPSSVVSLFAVAEVFFNLGVYLMLRGSGVFKIRLRDLLRFRLDNAHFSTGTFTTGFVMNRLSASVPWIYVLGLGWRKLPATLLGLIILELLVVLILTLGVFEFTRGYVYKKS